MFSFNKNPNNFASNILAPNINNTFGITKINLNNTLKAQSLFNSNKYCYNARNYNEIFYRLNPSIIATNKINNNNF